MIKIWGEEDRKKGGVIMSKDMIKVGVSEVYAEDRNKWKCRTRVAEFKQLGEKAKKNKKSNNSSI